MAGLPVTGMVRAALARILRVLLLPLLCRAVLGSGNFTISSLSGHNPNAFAATSSCGLLASGSNRQRILCNLQVYDLALAVAKHTGSRLAIFPEYGLSSTNESSASFFELALPVGALACENGTADVPQQHFLSCASLRYGMTIAAQVMTRNDRGAHHISLIVFDETGHTQALYHKHFLFETETPLFTPGSWHPTVVTIAGRTLGLIVCWELYRIPLTDDDSQVQSMLAQGATSLVWSGGLMPFFPRTLSWETAASLVAARNVISVAASILFESGGYFTLDSRVAGARTRVAADDLAAIGYKAELFLDTWTVP